MTKKHSNENSTSWQKNKTIEGADLEAYKASKKQGLQQMQKKD